MLEQSLNEKQSLDYHQQKQLHQQKSQKRAQKRFQSTRLRVLQNQKIKRARLKLV
jgi:hypothetical protein